MKNVFAGMDLEHACEYTMKRLALARAIRSHVAYRNDDCHLVDVPLSQGQVALAAVLSIPVVWC